MYIVQSIYIFEVATKRLDTSIVIRDTTLAIVPPEPEHETSRERTQRFGTAPPQPEHEASRSRTRHLGIARD